MDEDNTVHIEISDEPDGGLGTLDAILAARAKAHGDKLAFIDSPDRPDRGLGKAGQFTFSQLDERVDVLSRHLARTGLAAGDYIVFQLPNTIEAPLILLAAWRIGLVACPLPLHWRREEINQAFTRVKPKAALSIATYGEDTPAQTLGEVAAHHMSIRHVLGFGEGLPDGITPIDGWFSEIGNDSRDGADPVSHSVQSQDPALVSWAVSKSGRDPVVRTHASLVALGEQFVQCLRLNRNDVHLNCYPYSATIALGGSLAAPLLTGATVHLHLPFDFELFSQQLEHGGITRTLTPPAVIHALARHDRFEELAGTLKGIGCVWPGPHDGLADDSDETASLAIYDIHNLNEIGLGIAKREQGVAPALMPLGKQFAVEAEEAGERDVPLLETRVRGSVSGSDEHHKLTGRLALRGRTTPNGSPGSGNGTAPDKSEKFMPDAQGFIDTGLECIVEEKQGRYFRCVRNPEIFYHGGSVVAASELDAMYVGYPDFLDAAAFSIDDAVMGERIFAAVVPRPELSPSLAEFRNYLAEKRVASYKTPEQLVIVRSIPRSLDGQVLRDQILNQL